MSKRTIEQFLEDAKAREAPCDSEGSRCEIDYIPTPDGEMKTCSPTCPISVMRIEHAILIEMVDSARTLGEKWEKTYVPGGYHGVGEAMARVDCGRDLLEAVEDLVPEEKAPSTPSNAS